MCPANTAAPAAGGKLRCAKHEPGTAAMPCAGVGTPVVGGYKDKPVFIVLFLTLFHGFPHLFQYGVFRHYAPIAYVSVSVVVVCVIRIPQIQPVEVGCVVEYAIRSAFASAS